MARNTSMSSHQWDTAIDQEVSPLFLNLQWAQAKSIDVIRPLMAKYQVSLAEFDVLATLRNAPSPHELTPTQIQNEVVITSGGLTKILLQLERRGLVKRLIQKDDLRIKPVTLTTQGNMLINVAMVDVMKTTSQWIRVRLDQEQMRQLTVLLRQLVNK